MKLPDIHRAFVKCDLVPLDKDALFAIAKSAQGKTMESLLERILDGDMTARPDLESMARAAAPEIRSILQSLGYASTMDEVLPIALEDGPRLFDALRRIKDDDQGSKAARHFIDSLGFTKAKMTTPTASAAGDPPYYNFHVYGKAGALCFSEASTRAGKQATVQIDAATALSANGNTAFDWAGKIVVQLTPQECFQLLALLEGLLDKVQFDGHGARHDKSVTFEVQQTHYYVKIIQRGRAAVNVPVPPTDAIRIVALLYRQIQLNDPHLDRGLIQDLVKNMVRMMKTEITRT